MRAKSKILIGLLTLVGLTCGAVPAAESLATLQIGSATYSNVTVTTVTTTDVYFTHAKGLGNAKLKNLSPDLQRRFHYDAAKSSMVEQAQAEATAVFLRTAATNRFAAARSEDSQEDVETPTVDASGDLVVKKLYAASFRGQRSPTILVDQWLTPPPDVTNKFVLVDFWATWVAPARAAIPQLNALQARFKDRLVVIGLSNETVEEMYKMTAPKVGYYVGTDPQARTMAAFQLGALPHSVLIDPAGIVRYEGHSKYLDGAALERLLTKYAP